MRAIPPVYEVGMAVDEGGRDPPSFAIDDPSGGARGGRKLGFEAGENDSAVARGNRAGFDDPEPRAPLGEGCEPGVEPYGVGTIAVACLNHGAQPLRLN